MLNRVTKCLLPCLLLLPPVCVLTVSRSAKARRYEALAGEARSEIIAFNTQTRAGQERQILVGSPVRLPGKDVTGKLIRGLQPGGELLIVFAGRSMELVEWKGWQELIGKHRIGVVFVLSLATPSTVKVARSRVAKGTFFVDDPRNRYNAVYKVLRVDSGMRIVRKADLPTSSKLTASKMGSLANEVMADNPKPR